MSHFSVLVCIADPDRLDEVLAPFGENLEVEPYRDYEDGGPVEYWAVKHLREENGLNPDDATLTWQQVADVYNARCSEDDDKLLVDDGGRAYTMSTRNPQAKWDYWRVGGRWGGYFPVVPGRERDIIMPERGWDSPDIKPGWCNGGPKSALDLAALREAKAAEARVRYGLWCRTVEGTPEALPWRVFADNVEEHGYTIDQARKDFHAQPRVQAYQATEEFRWYDDAIERFSVSEAMYVERGKAQAVPGFALVTMDGRWMAPGTMGWFAMTDADEGSRAGYLEAANAYIETVPETAHLIAVDCHI